MDDISKDQNVCDANASFKHWFPSPKEKASRRYEVHAWKAGLIKSRIMSELRNASISLFFLFTRMTV